MSPITPADSQLSGFITYLITEGLLTESEAIKHNLEAQNGPLPRQTPSPSKHGQ